MTTEAAPTESVAGADLTARQRGKQDKRQAILDAAAPVFGGVGYERASVDAIAAAAGVSKPTIYSHFGGKEQLFRESVAESARQLNEESLAAIYTLDLRPKHWRQSLYQVGMQLVTCQRSECSASLGRLVNAEINRDPEVFRAVRERGAYPVLEALAGRLAMLGNAGYLKVSDPQLAAKQFYALIGSEMPDLTELGTKEVSDTVVRRAVHAGIDTFLLAYGA